MFELRYLADVATLELDPELCTACGSCTEVCPQGVLSLADGSRAVRIADRDACMECGACARNCPTGALQVQAGVGCATAILNCALGRRSSACCSTDCGCEG